MKKILCFLLMLILLVPALVAAGDDNPWDRKLPFQNATIQYTLNGLEKGIETLYIRKYGDETAKFHKTTTTMMGMTMANETIEITDPDWIYTFNLIERTGTKAANPQKYMIEEYNKLSQEDKEQVLKNSEEFGVSMGGKVEKNVVNILGFDCDMATAMGTTIYSIHDTGISLKTESNIMGMTITIEATKIDVEPAPQKLFDHPVDITPVQNPETDAISRSMARQTMNMLKDPEAAKKAADNPTYQNPNQQELTPEEQQQMEEAMEALKGIFGN